MKDCECFQFCGLLEIADPDSRKGILRLSKMESVSKAKSAFALSHLAFNNLISLLKLRVGFGADCPNLFLERRF